MSAPLHSVHPRLDSSRGAAAAGGAGLRAFTQIAELWHLSISEQLALLGITSRSTYFKWRKEPQPKLPRDTLERLSLPEASNDAILHGNAECLIERLRIS